MTKLHLSWIASCIVHRMTMASACKGEQRRCSLAQMKMTSPWWPFSIAASVDLVLLRAVSTLILIQLWGRGVQEVIVGSTEVWKFGVNALVISMNLACTLFLALVRLAFSFWNRSRFLVFHISSMMRAILSDMVHCSSAGMRAFGGSMISFRMSSFEASVDVLILIPQPTMVYKAQAKGH